MFINFLIFTNKLHKNEKHIIDHLQIFSSFVKSHQITYHYKQITITCFVISQETNVFCHNLTNYWLLSNIKKLIGFVISQQITSFCQE